MKDAAPTMPADSYSRSKEMNGVGEATLEAARVLFRAAGYTPDAIDRALVALHGREEAPTRPAELLAAQDVCDWLGVSLSTLWRWKIPHVKICGLRRFYRNEVEKFLHSRYVRKPHIG